jgi:hypothetical protein
MPGSPYARGVLVDDDLVAETAVGEEQIHIGHHAEPRHVIVATFVGAPMPRDGEQGKKTTHTPGSPVEVDVPPAEPDNGFLAASGELTVAAAGVHTTYQRDCRNYI